jgi:hypothetical protein
VFNSIVLDVAIGMAFVYLLLSLLCSAAAEVIAGVLGLRAKNLEAGIRSLFSDGFGPGDNAFVREIYEHGLVRGLYRDAAIDLVPAAKTQVTTLYEKATGKTGRQLPSYIPARTFSLALIDILAAAGKSISTPGTDSANTNTATSPPTIAKPPMESINDSLEALLPSSAKQALQSLYLNAGGDIDKLQANFEDWYNDAMDRTAGWYKRQNQKILLGLGLAVAILANANSITLARVLWLDKGIREATVANANDYMKGNPVPASNPSTQKDPVTGKPCPQAGPDAATCTLRSNLYLLQQKITAVSSTESQTLLPIGWTQGLWKGPFFTPINDGEHLKLLFISLAGWILTAIALSFGAPFWFDLLNKFMVVRSTIKPQEKSQVEGSKD